MPAADLQARSSLRLYLLVAAAVFVGTLVASFLGRRFYGDTSTIVAGLQAAFATSPWQPEKLSYFPLAAQVWVGAAAYLGGGHGPYQILAALNAAVLLTLLTCGARHLASGGNLRLGLLWGVAVMASPAWSYGFSVAFEPVVALLHVLLVIALTRRSSNAVVFSLSALAAICKETSPALIVALAYLVLAVDSPEPATRRRLWSITAAGAFVGLGANLSLNLLRFGSLTNSFYNTPELNVSDPQTYADFFAGLWASPSAGLIWHWPVLILVLAWLIRWSLLSSEASVRRGLWRRILGAVAFLLLLTAGFAKWHAPFGWIGWSNRLLIPWLPAILLLLLDAWRKDVPSQSRPAPHFVVAVVAAVVGALGFMQVLAGAALTTGMIIFEPTALCPTIPLFWDDIPHYYACTHGYMWNHWLLPLEMAEQHGAMPSLAAFGGLATLAYIALRGFRVRTEEA